MRYLASQKPRDGIPSTLENKADVRGQAKHELATVQSADRNAYQSIIQITEHPSSVLSSRSRLHHPTSSVERGCTKTMYQNEAH